MIVTDIEKLEIFQNKQIIEQTLRFRVQMERIS